MKIAFLSIYSGYVPRGVETYVHELANRLSINNDVVVYQAGPELNGAKYKTIRVDIPIDWSNKKLRESASRRFFLDYWSVLKGKFTLKVLNAFEPFDIVIPTNGGWQSLLCRIWCWKNKKKMIISGQSGPGWDDRINLLLRPDVFIGLTKWQTNWAVKNGLGVPVVTIPNGVDLTVFNPSVKPVELHLPKPIFFCVAALDSNKRIDLVIKAIQKLGKGSLLIAGTGDLKDELEKMGNDLLPNRFKMVLVPHSEIPNYYTAADVMTMVPVHVEAFGIVYIEAMACGLPVVAVNDKVREEIIGSAGYLIDAENINEYVKALQKALYKDWGDIPRKQAEKFSWDKIAKQYDQVFHNITGL